MPTLVAGAVLLAAVPTLVAGAVLLAAVVPTLVAGALGPLGAATAGPAAVIGVTRTPVTAPLIPFFCFVDDVVFGRRADHPAGYRLTAAPLASVPPFPSATRAQEKGRRPAPPIAPAAPIAKPIAAPPEPAPPAPAPWPAREPAPQPAPTPAPSCDPNYVIDTEGNKIFKPECFQGSAPPL